VTSSPSARPAVVAPRLFPSPRLARPTELLPHDAWNDERLVGADLGGCVADHVEIAACELRGVLLTGTELERLRLVDVVATHCELSGAVMHEASMVRVESATAECQAWSSPGRSCPTSGRLQARRRELPFRGGGASHVRPMLARRCRFLRSHARRRGVRFLRPHERAVLEGNRRRVRLIGSRLDGVRGAIGMSGVVIGGDQVLPLALSAFL
jgi:hypothetical protein